MSLGDMYEVVNPDAVVAGVNSLFDVSTMTGKPTGTGPDSSPSGGSRRNRCTLVGRTARHARGCEVRDGEVARSRPAVRHREVDVDLRRCVLDVVDRHSGPEVDRDVRAEALSRDAKRVRPPCEGGRVDHAEERAIDAFYLVDLGHDRAA